MAEALYMLAEKNYPVVYPPRVRAELDRRLEVRDRPVGRDELADATARWPGVRVLLTGWGAPRLDGGLLDRLPDLRLVSHAGGTVRALVSDELWSRGVRVTHAAEANAASVAETTCALILLSLKEAWLAERRSRLERRFIHNEQARGGIGGPVGLVSLGAIGRAVAARLRDRLPDVSVLAYEPYADPAEAERLGVTRVELAELFERCFVVSLHTPLLPETRGIIGGSLLERLPPRATLINTARGGLIDEPQLRAWLAKRPDATAVLDVTDPEPPPADSPWWSTPNAVIYPHLAGASGREAEVLGRSAVAEAGRFVRGEPLHFEVTPDRLARMA